MKLDKLRKLITKQDERKLNTRKHCYGNNIIVDETDEYKHVTPETKGHITPALVAEIETGEYHHVQTFIEETSDCGYHIYYHPDFPEGEHKAQIIEKKIVVDTLTSSLSGAAISLKRQQTKEVGIAINEAHEEVLYDRYSNFYFFKTEGEKTMFILRHA